GGRNLAGPDRPSSDRPAGSSSPTRDWADCLHQTSSRSSARAWPGTPYSFGGRTDDQRRVSGMCGSGQQPEGATAIGDMAGAQPGEGGADLPLLADGKSLGDGGKGVNCSRAYDEDDVGPGPTLDRLISPICQVFRQTSGEVRLQP